MSEKAKVRAADQDQDRYILETHIRPLITQALIDEHRRTPIALHSPELDIVLKFLRRDTDKSRPRYVLVCTIPEKEYCIAEHSRVRGTPITLLTAERFGSQVEAEHAVFRKRLKNLGLWG